MFKTIIKYFLILALFSMPALALDKDEIYSAVKEKYGNLDCITVKFKEKNSGISGTLSAKRSNKYILELNDRTIVCNGKRSGTTQKMTTKLLSAILKN